MDEIIDTTGTQDLITSSTSARQCGKTTNTDMIRAIHLMAKENNTQPDHIKVGCGTLRVLKTLNNTVFTKPAPQGMMDKFHGIPIYENNLLREYDYAFCDKSGNILALGNIKEGNHNEYTEGGHGETSY